MSICLTQLTLGPYVVQIRSVPAEGSLEAGGALEEEGGGEGKYDAEGAQVSHPGVELRANFKTTSHRCYLFTVAFVRELTREIIHSPLGCLQGGICLEPLYRATSLMRNCLPPRTTIGPYEDPSLSTLGKFIRSLKPKPSSQ